MNDKKGRKNILRLNFFFVSPAESEGGKPDPNLRMRESPWRNGSPMDDIYHISPAEVLLLNFFISSGFSMSFVLPTAECEY